MADSSGEDLMCRHHYFGAIDEDYEGSDVWRGKLRVSDNVVLDGRV